MIYLPLWKKMSYFVSWDDDIPFPSHMETCSSYSYVPVTNQQKDPHSAQVEKDPIYPNLNDSETLILSMSLQSAEMVSQF